MKIEIRSRFTGAVIFTHEADGATMRDAVRDALHQGVSLRGVDLSGSNLRGAKLRGVDLSGSNLRGAKLSGVDLSGSNLRGSDLSDSDLSGVDLSGSNLRGAKLSGSNLSGSNLRGSNLRDSNLRGSNLRGSDLSDSDLSGSDLSGSDLRDSDLSGSNLSGSDLRGSDLSGSDLTPIRDDIWAVLSSAPREVPAVIEALKAGRVDGSTYRGPCACLVGTIAIKREVGVDDLEGLRPNSSRPAERFFMGISEGDTPETNQFSALALDWVQQWHDNMVAAFGQQAQ